MRIVFMGSPDFALPTLRRLLDSEHEVVGVYTQPDRPVGRGRKPSPPPVKALAEGRGVPVFQPGSISARTSVEGMRALRPDLGVLAAYGQILRDSVLEVPRLGILNVHASLLPRWRGAAPVAAAILAGDAETGATIMRVVRALDAGPMLGAVRLRILRDDTAGTVTARIAEAGADLLMGLLPAYERGELPLVEQDDALATYAPQIEKGDALIRWDAAEALTIERQVRAYNPWPVAFCYFEGRPLRVLEAVALEQHSPGAPGTVVAWTDAGGAAFAVTTIRGDLGVRAVQPPGGKVMTAAAFRNGHRDIIGARLTSGPGAG